ncbi:MAG: ATP-binding protein [Lacipirellulaceae bacterium]
MVPRRDELAELLRMLKSNPVVGIVGARQVGKTTLARDLVKAWVGDSKRVAHHFDLEDPIDQARLADPMLTLASLRGLVVLDEVQMAPQLFPVLRVLADRRPLPARFLVLGSTSPDLIRQGGESLAGRIVYRTLSGFSLAEVGQDHADRLWLRGSFPRSYLAPTHALSREWRLGFIRTFLERDLPQLGLRIGATTLRRFWTMLAHNHGQLWNASVLGRSFGVSDTTVRGYLDWLTGALVVRQLQPWHENTSKRQVKAPKVYLSDSGLLHSLLGVTTMPDLMSHPILGASWEGFAIAQVVAALGVEPEECFFWRTHAGAELDLLTVRGRKRWGFEVKRSSAPSLTKSMRTAVEDLGLQRLFVVHAGREAFDLSKTVRAVPLRRLLTDLPTW